MPLQGKLLLGHDGRVRVETDVLVSSLLVPGGDTLDFSIRVDPAGVGSQDPARAEDRAHAHLPGPAGGAESVERAVVDEDAEAEFLAHHGDRHQDDLIDLRVGGDLRLTLVEAAEDLPLGIAVRLLPLTGPERLPALRVGDAALERVAGVPVHEGTPHTTQKALRVARLRQLE